MSWSATCDYELTKDLYEEADAAIVYSYRKGVWRNAWAIPICAVFFSLAAIFMNRMTDNLIVHIAGIVCGIMAVVCIVFTPYGL